MKHLLIINVSIIYILSLYIYSSWATLLHSKNQTKLKRHQFTHIASNFLTHASHLFAFLTPNASFEVTYASLSISGPAQSCKEVTDVFGRCLLETSLEVLEQSGSSLHDAHEMKKYVEVVMKCIQNCSRFCETWGISI